MPGGGGQGGRQRRDGVKSEGAERSGRGKDGRSANAASSAAREDPASGDPASGDPASGDGCAHATSAGTRRRPAPRGGRCPPPCGRLAPAAPSAAAVIDPRTPCRHLRPGTPSVDGGGGGAMH